MSATPALQVFFRHFRAIPSLATPTDLIGNRG